MTIAPERSDGPSLIDSSETDWDFSGLKAAEETAGTPEADTESQDRTAESKVCPSCNLPIIREPGQRGKLAKYHPACKPTRSIRNTFTETTRRTTTANVKAGREADEVIGMLKPQLFKAALVLSAIDKYDAFVFMNGIPGLCTSIHGVLVRYDSFRRDALAMKTGGSIFGLIFTGLTIALPILAHHGLIPGERIQQALINFPVMMFKLMQRMSEGEQALQEMMNRVSEEMLRPKNAPTPESGASADATA